MSLYSCEPGLGAIRNPVQLLCGSKDASLAGTKALQTAIPGSKLIEIPGAGHISNVENPSFFTHTLVEFLTAEL